MLHCCILIHSLRVICELAYVCFSTVASHPALTCVLHITLSSSIWWRRQTVCGMNERSVRGLVAYHGVDCFSGRAYVLFPLLGWTVHPDITYWDILFVYVMPVVLAVLWPRHLVNKISSVHISHLPFSLVNPAREYITKHFKQKVKNQFSNQHFRNGVHCLWN